MDAMTLDPVTKLRRDIKGAAITLTDTEARYLVDAYYLMQEDRKRAHNQDRAMGESGEPHEVIGWLADQSGVLEKQIARALDAYSDASPVGQWARSVVGIGPIIAAGLLAHINLQPWRCRNPDTKKSCREDDPCTAACAHEVIETAGHIWRFAGLDPTSRWEKGKRRPWNAGLKVLCWKIGESFVKVSGNEQARYGAIYAERKQYETERNEAGAYAEQAARVLQEKNIGKGTEAFKHYSAGRLPPAHIHARAKRYAVKLFLAHYHHVAYVERFGREPPMPYAIAVMGHAHYLAPR